MKLPIFKIRASAASEILAGSISLTDAQLIKLTELSDRKDKAEKNVAGIKALTPNMEAELAGLIYKRDNPELPIGAKSYCEKWLKEKLYDRRKNFQSKYLEKGLKCEDASIKFAAESFKWGQIVKNDEWFSDDWMEGTPDIITQLFLNQVISGIETSNREIPVVIDMKNVWDCFTLPLFESEIPTVGYEVQLQVYMHLVSQEYKMEVNDALLCYALMDAPLDVMEKEMRKLSWGEGNQGLITDEIRCRVHKEMSYSDIPCELRLKVYHLKRDPSIIVELKKRVEMCRIYISTLIKAQDHLRIAV